jgi:hypothetical protein
VALGADATQRRDRYDVNLPSLGAIEKVVPVVGVAAMHRRALEGDVPLDVVLIEKPQVPSGTWSRMAWA